MKPQDASAEERRVGLCRTCRHHRRVEARKGSVFYLCRRSVEDPEYPKYPPLPVLRCLGYEPGEHPG